MPYFSSDYDQRNVGLKYDVKHIKSEDMVFAALKFRFELQLWLIHEILTYIHNVNQKIC